MMVQIQRNELILKQCGRIQEEQEFEIQCILSPLPVAQHCIIVFYLFCFPLTVKSTKLAELRQLNATKTAELTKSTQLHKNLEQTEAAARRNAKK